METDFLVEAIRRCGPIRTLCDHCSNESFKDRICDSTVRGKGDSAVQYLLWRCRICKGVILCKVIYQLPSDYRGKIQNGAAFAVAEGLESEQLWPPPASLPPEVPGRICDIYEEARLVRRSPSSFVTQIGRALEAITRDKNADGQTLNERLNWLINQELLPQVFGQMGHINRILRNWGAHDADTDVQPQDIEIVDEFFRAIVEYLYIAPVKVGRIQELLDRRRRDA